MNKKRVSLILTSVLFSSVTAAGFANVNPQVCRELVSAVSGSQTIPNSILASYGQDVKPCLASCGSLYGNGVDAATLNSIAVCRKSLSSLSFDNTYYNTSLQQASGVDANLNQTANLAVAATPPTKTATPNAQVPPPSTTPKTNTSASTNTSTTTDSDDSQETNSNDQQTIRWF